MMTGDRISGWKEIANYLGCNERTAQRWEGELDLPIHRIPGKSAKSRLVFGHKNELDEWMGTHSHLFKKEAADTVSRQTSRLSVAQSPTQESQVSEGKDCVIPAPEQTALPSHRLTGFGEHTGHVIASSVLNGLVYATSFGLQLAHEFDRHRDLFIWGTTFILLWFVAVSLFTFRTIHRQAARKRMGWICSYPMIAGTVFAYLVFYAFLPDYPVTRATFSTYSAQAAFLKDVLYLLPYGLFLLVMPFCLVMALRYELNQGRRSMVAGLLRGNRGVAPPKGTLFVKPGYLFGLFIAFVFAWLPGGFHLTDNLIPGPYSGLFQTLYWVRWGLFVAMGLECLAAYSLALNDLKREAIALAHGDRNTYARA